MRHGVAEVEVYDVRLSLKRRIPVVELTYPYDVASCANNNCSYIWDRTGKRVYRVEWNENAINWTVKSQPLSLSVTPKSNIIVTTNEASTLNEFTNNGGYLVREIKLNENVTYPPHAVQLTWSQLLVSHMGSQDTVYDKCSTIFRRTVGLRRWTTELPQPSVSRRTRIYSCCWTRQQTSYFNKFFADFR